ncbi:signal transduction histidine kinase/CheY-like chemotaxis protein [Paucibacter oligotrophus]|uniref:histidine kinase n=1 Tax=Roseateles oligotrophus TaxID=1769250 RepID=A0A840LB16_9BURK|nr:hybrid sensor histidine kinase/response regulator [Roseateles oligotrophus]MBB4845774.1 signal transduction histidine kinase/CheY-like chemotaxis protein [Roseateles oligotrophus]
MKKLKERLSQAWRNVFPPALAQEDLSPAGRARLLDLMLQRLVFSICTLPFFGLVLALWFQGFGRNQRGLRIWTACYVLASLLALLMRRRFLRDLQADSSEELLLRWQSRVRRLGQANALGLAALGLTLFLASGRSEYDFVLLPQIGLALLIVANARSQLPTVGILLRFLGLGWGIATVVYPLTRLDWPPLIAEPSLARVSELLSHSPWPFVLPVSLLFLLVLYRHALITQNFFHQQIKLEEQAARLAQQYQAAKEEAEQALQSKNLFMRTASHDLRQPVHAMSFLIESIAHRNQDAALRPALADLRQAAQSLGLMFGALLDLSRIENGHVSVNPQLLALKPLLQEVATLFSAEAQSLGLSLRVRAAAADAVVFADPVLLRQSLVNLLHNAMRYTRRGGILLAARRRGPDWRLEVWDSGLGIPAAERSRIFSPFYRHVHAHAVDGGGHGLGLAVVARCAKLMGAGYGLDSVEGRGSRFFLRLQSASSLGLAALVQSPPALPRGPLSGACLVVEDDRQVASAWASLMQAWGLEVRCVEDEEQALAALQSGFLPQAILCDQGLRSGQSGVQVLKKLLGLCPDASGAMVSAEWDSEDLLAAEQEGYLVLRKPLAVEQLHALLCQWLRG